MSQSNDGRAKAISLFSGLGGIDIGLHKAGIETVACVEKDETAAKTLKVNSKQHPEQPDQSQISVSNKYPWRVVNSDIRDLNAEDILEPCNSSMDEIDIVVGGPPCQTFSRSNEGSRSGTDTDRGKLYQEYARILHQIQPDAFLFENVRGLKSANGGKDLEVIIEDLEGGFYQSKFKVLNTANFGVPQTRKRILIVGTKPDAEFTFPEPTHTEGGGEDSMEWVSAGQALSKFDIDKEIENKGGYQNAIGSKYGPLLKDIPQGANYQHFSERKYDTDQEKYVERADDELDEREFDWRSRHWNYLLKMDQERPSWTIQAAPGTTVGPFHWRARDLSLLEQMELMAIPLDYYIAGKPSKIQQQIGNAVPPDLVEAAATKLVEELNFSIAEFNDPEHGKCIENESAGEATIKIQDAESPWHYANKILSSFTSENTVFIEAKQQAIPYAIDAIEIAKRQADFAIQFDVTEKVLEDESEKGGSSSSIEVKTTSKKPDATITV